MKASIPKVNPGFVHDKIQSGLSLHFLDVRSENEFRSEHAQGATLIPLKDINANRLKSLLGDKAGSDEPVYLICTAGIRAQQAAENLQSQGMDKLFVVNGGIDAWKASGLPINRVHSKKPLLSLSPQAQAQLIMGMMILLFAVKGMLLHPAFTVMVGFIGVLMLVAAFDQRFCLAKVISDMPWNKA